MPRLKAGGLDLVSRAQKAFSDEEEININTQV